MACPSCGAENPAAAKFCGECGARLPRRCPQCHHEVGATAKFCLECGHGLAATSPRNAGSPAASSSPQGYTPRDLAEKILATRAALEGERKQVTVLFADIVGSTELIQGRDAEEAQALLDGVVKIMMDAVHRYEGTVSRLTGDGLMAMFGAPVAHEDHAVRACYAALAMLEAVRRHAHEARPSIGATPTIRVGLSAGEVVVRTIRDDLHMDYTAIGHTVHLASRMEQLAEPGTATLTAETLRLVDGYVEVRSLGSVSVKGLGAPIELFQLLGPGQARTRLHAAAARGLTRFVGRQTELAALLRARALADAGRGQVVAVIGEPGLGKSRLLHEFTHLQSLQGWTILEGSAVSYGTAASYLPVVDLLKGYFGIADRDDARTVGEKLRGKLLALDDALEPTVPAFLSLLDMPTDDPRWQALDPPRRRRQMLDAITRLLLRASQHQPLLLVVENLHWLDRESQSLLDELVDRLPGARILLVVSYRPEYHHGWGSRPCYMQLRLEPLQPAHAEELLEAWLGAELGLQSLKQLLVERTEGNPFFLEEMVRALVDADVLVGERGDYRLARDPPSVHIPATVRAVLAARMDRLLPEDKHLLQSAAVLGREVPFSLLQAIAEVPEDELHAGLTRLQAAELLYQVHLSSESSYSFTHALTHEVAYAGLLRERRRVLHAKVVDAIERLDADRLAGRIERLAHHSLRGEVWDKALDYCRQAGRKAAARSANRAAVAWYEQALDALRHVPERRETLEQAIELRLDLRPALAPLAETGRSLAYLREAEGLAQALGDRARLGRVCAAMTTCLWQLGEHDQAIEVGSRALAIAETLGDIQLQVATNLRLAQAYLHRGEYRRAIDGLKANVVALEGDLLRERFGMWIYPAVESRAILAWYLAELGEFAEGAAYGEAALRLAERLDHPYSLSVAHVNLGGLYLLRGQLDRALAVLERGLDLCRTWDFPEQFPPMAARLGAAYALAGRVAEGLPLLEQAVGRAEAGGMIARGSLWAGWLAEAYLAAGRLDDATRLASRALDLAAGHNERGKLAWALRLMGDVAAHRDPLELEPVGDYFRRALGLAEELGMRPLRAHCHVGLGRLYRKIGRAEEARVELRRAVEMLDAMGMTHWLPEAEAELAEASASLSAQR